MTAVLLLAGVLAGFLIGLWLIRMTRSDTWEHVVELERRVDALEQRDD